MFFVKQIDTDRLTFSPTPLSTESPKKLTTLLFTGDVMLGRSVNIASLESNNPNYPFEKVQSELKNADLTVINLENPIVENCPQVDSGFKFCTDPKNLQGLVNAGVDVITLANNHTYNYGTDGFNQTKNYLDNAQISYTGDNNLVIKTVNNMTFGFLGFDKSQQGNPTLSDGEVQLIKSANQQVDILVVAMHWGTEYQNTALPGVQSLAKELVSLGADVVVGHHPHWVQNIEYINDKPVYYSLGNFIFDQMWSEETRSGLAIRLTFDGSEIIKEERLPVYMRQIGQPEWVRE